MSKNLSPYNRKVNSSIESNDNNEKDILIMRLKSELFEQEQSNKNYSSLESKYRNLQNEYNLLSEEKLRLEYDLKQKTESLSHQIQDIRTENENLQNGYNDKLALNKKLFNDNNNLFRNCEVKTNEITNLREQVADLIELNSKLELEKNSLEKNVSNLSELKQNQKANIDKLENELVKIEKYCDEQDAVLKQLENDKSSLLNKNDELSFEIKNLYGKVKAKEENLNHTQRQLEDANKNIAKLEVLKN